MLILEGEMNFKNVAFAIMYMMASGELSEIPDLMEKFKWILDKKYIYRSDLDFDGSHLYDDWWQDDWLPLYNYENQDDYIAVERQWTLLQKVLEFVTEINDLWDKKYKKFDFSSIYL